MEKNLLIIDDEVEITKSLARQFRRVYNTFTATSAKDALKIMEEERIQVIISDQRMPDTTGVDFFSQIKDRFPNALKLILTGYSDIDAVIEAINEGQVYRYITKPWNPTELDSIVKAAYEKAELVEKNKILMEDLSAANKLLEEKVKKRTEELELKNESLEHLNKEKNKYLGIVAHDLRNPIATSIMFAGLLTDDYDKWTKEEHLEFAGEIHENCTFSLKLMENLLDVSKIEAGIFDLELEQTEYISFIEKVVRETIYLAKQKSQDIRISHTINSVHVQIDKNKIKQVVTNLLTNAIKYSAKGTEIIVKISTDDYNLTTSIIDHGQGIPSEELDGIFNAYKVSSVKATDDEKSTGLGLAIVNKIVKAHHGQCSVSSTVGKGSKFLFNLPLPL